MPRRGLGYGFGPYAPEPYDDRGADRISDLMLRGGDIAARRGETSGQIWGNALANLGQIAGGAIAQIGAQKAEREGVEAEAAKNQEFTQFLGQWDGDPAKLAETSVSLYGPEQGYKIAEATMRFSMLGQEDPQEAVKDWAKGIQLMDSLDEDKKATFYPGMIAASVPLAEKFGIDPAMLPQEYSPEAWDFAKKLAAVGLGESPPELITAGGGIYDPEAEQWIMPPEKEKVPEAPKAGTFESFVASQYPEGATPEQQLGARRQWEAAGRAPKAAPNPEDAAYQDLEADAWAEGKAFPSTQEATTAALRSFARRGLPVPRKLTAKQQDEVLLTANTLTTIQDVRSLYERVKDKVGPWTYQLNELGQKIPGIAADPDFAEFNAMLRGMGNLEIKRITGAQMSEAEAGRLLKGMATGTLKREEFEAALRVMERNAQRNRDIILYGQAQPMKVREGAESPKSGSAKDPLGLGIFGDAGAEDPAGIF